MGKGRDRQGCGIRGPKPEQADSVHFGFLESSLRLQRVKTVLSGKIKE